MRFHLLTKERLMRRGIVQQPQQQTSNDVPTHNVVGRQLKQPTQQEREYSRLTPPVVNAPLITSATQRTQSGAVRGLMVGTDGRPLRGLSHATIQAHKAQTEDCTELCERCGQLRPPAEMVTTVTNVVKSDRPQRICKVECTKLVYKDPGSDQDRWQPSVPLVRFDRERGTPYNAQAQGVTIAELVNKDTYRSEQESDSRPYVSVTSVDAVNGYGKWSGGNKAGHVPTPSSLEQSRVRVQRARTRR
jgi:hypothetical protein